MIFIPEDFKFNHIKKTNIVAKRLMEGTIREIKECPKEDREMLLSQCVEWRPDDYNLEYREISTGFQIFKRYLMIKGFQCVKYAEDIDYLKGFAFCYLRVEIDKDLIESCQMLTSKR